MSKWLIMPLLLIPLSVSATPDNVQTIKAAFDSHTPLDITDWYKKGDAEFGEYEGEISGFEQKIKASIRPNQVSARFELIKSGREKNRDTFMLDSTRLCRLVFRDFILSEKQLQAAKSWDNNEPDVFAFMNAETLSASLIHDTDSGPPKKNINGWSVSIQRSLNSTVCSAKKDG
ncbi:hypothetical protein SAMN05428958_102540 [Pantoea sesami]|nr:hypothetical protein SAMN05428958_102540 [Pantoea sesami]